MNKITHVGLTVSDIGASIDFYTDIGMDVLDVSNRDSNFMSSLLGLIPEAVSATIAYLHFPKDNIHLELVQYIAQPWMLLPCTYFITAPGTSHVCFVVSNFDSIATRVEIVGDICIVPAGPNEGRRVMYAHDPDKNFIEFLEA